MIQSILFFLLGFLGAGLVALLLAPALARRTERLTRRRLEATLPMSLNELQAEKDRYRAEHAMNARRLEMEAAIHRDKANDIRVENARLDEEIKRLTGVITERDGTIGERDEAIAALENTLAERQSEASVLGGRLTDAERHIEESLARLEEMTRGYDEATLVSSNRQIDLIARESEIDRLSTTIAQLRSKRQESEKQTREQAAEKRRLAEDLKGEQRKVADLERRLARLVSELSDRDERLERREKVIQRLRAKDGSGDSAAEAAEDIAETDNKAEAAKLTQALAEAARVEEGLRFELTEARAALMRLEAELAGMQDDRSGAEEDREMDAALERLDRDRNRLEERLTALAEENERLRGQSGSKGDAADFGLLRDELAEIAAQMVHVTRRLEGPGSPIDAALGAPGPRAGKKGRPTLADRISALQAEADSSAAKPAKPVKGDR